MIEELTNRNCRGVWTREIEKVLNRHDMSLELFLERVNKRDEEIQKQRLDKEIQKSEEDQLIRAKRAKSIEEVME